MTKNKLTHGGTKKSTFVQINGAEFYFSRPVGNKKGSTFVNITGVNPITGARQKVRLDARQLKSLLATVGAE